MNQTYTNVSGWVTLAVIILYVALEIASALKV
jgi:hypothetical protein